MTNTEAIETLRANYPDACYDQLRQAVDAAIEVLKVHDATGDTINRQAAIQTALEFIVEYLGGAFDEALQKKLMERMNALPSAQPEQAIKDCRNCKFGKYNDHWNTNFCYCSDDCNNWDKWEPSAQPKQKKGHWIVVTRHEHYPSGKPYEKLQCPFCKKFDHNGDGNFCGYCGAEMQSGENDG